MWCSETPFGVCGTYGWAGGAAPQASRERTLAAAPRRRGARRRAEAGAERLIVEGENVPSQAGFGREDRSAPLDRQGRQGRAWRLRVAFGDGGALGQRAQPDPAREGGGRGDQQTTTLCG